MALKELNFVEGQDLSNRARYWVHRKFQEQEIAWDDVDVTHISIKTFWNFVRDRRDISLNKLLFMADILGCTPRDLLLPIPKED